MRYSTVTKSYIRTDSRAEAEDFLMQGMTEGVTAEITLRAVPEPVNEVMYVYGMKDELLYRLDFLNGRYERMEEGNAAVFHLSVHEAMELRAYLTCVMRGTPAQLRWSAVARDVRQRGDPLRNLRLMRRMERLPADEDKFLTRPAWAEDE